MIQAQVRQAFLNLWQSTGVKEKILFTIAIIALFRFGVHVPIGGIDHAVLAQKFGDGNMLAGFLDMFSGGAFAKFSIFALGITPYINASIIMQLMTPVIPKLEELQKEGGEAGRKQIGQYTRYLTIALAANQGFWTMRWLWQLGVLKDAPTTGGFPWLLIIGTVTVLIAGTMFVMWLGELITERGIGNGASILIMIGILSRMPYYFERTAESVNVGATSWWGVAMLAIAFLAILVAIVVVQEGARRIPVQSARKQVGRRTVQGRASYIPLKVNQGGVMPIIFASSLLLLPVTISNFLGKPQTLKATWAVWTTDFWHLANIRSAFYNLLNQMMAALSPSGWLYAVVYFLLIVFFTYFYASLVLNPTDLADNLKKYGSFIPGCRPGKPTADFLENVLNKITFIGAMFLGFVSLAPNVVEQATGITTFQGLGATALLIMVGVAVDLYNQLQTQLLARQYEGFMK